MYWEVAHNCQRKANFQVEIQSAVFYDVHYAVDCEIIREMDGQYVPINRNSHAVFNFVSSRKQQEFPACIKF